MTKKCQLSRYESKKLIKHAPLRPYIHNELDTTVYIQSKTPFISAVKRIEKIINKFDKIPNKNGELVSRGNLRKSCKFITVKGMGKSIEKVINIGLHFKYDENFTVDIFTKSVGVLDEFVDAHDEENTKADSEDDENLLRKRNVGAVEVRIYINNNNVV